MDRREALKKLGVGTAVAIAAPAVLPTTRVAYAASGGIGQTGLIGVPPAGDPVPWTPIYDPANAWREVRIEFDTSAVTSADGSTPEFSAQWRIASTTMPSSKGYKRLRVTTLRTDANVPFDPSYPAGTEIASMPLVKNSFSGGAYGPTVYALTFLIRERYKNDEKKSDDGALDANTSYTMVAMCRWHTPGASTDVVAEYAFSGTGLNMPTVTNLSWDDQAPA